MNVKPHYSKIVILNVKHIYVGVNKNLNNNIQ